MADYADVETRVISWDDYPIKERMKAAPPANFYQREDPPENHFEPGYLLKAKDPKDPKGLKWCLAEVLKTKGVRICLRLKFVDFSRDFWEICDSANIGPLEELDMWRLEIPEPYGVTIVQERFHLSLKTALKDSKRAPPDWFHAPPERKPTGNLFELRQILEVVDSTVYRESKIWPGTVVAVKKDNIVVSFNGWGSEYNVKLPYYSRDIFPCGWSSKANHPLCWKKTKSRPIPSPTESPPPPQQRRMVVSTRSDQSVSSSKTSTPPIPSEQRRMVSTSSSDQSVFSRNSSPPPIAVNPRPPSAASNVQLKLLEGKFARKTAAPGSLSAAAQAKFLPNLASSPKGKEPGELRLDISTDSSKDDVESEAGSEAASSPHVLIGGVSPDSSPLVSPTETVSGESVSLGWMGDKLSFPFGTVTPVAQKTAVVEPNTITVTAFINGRCNAGSLLDVGCFRGKRVGPAPLKEVFVEIVETLLSFTKESPEDLLKLIPPANSVPFDYKLGAGTVRGNLPVLDDLHSSDLIFWQRVYMLLVAMDSCQNFVKPIWLDGPCEFCASPAKKQKFSVEWKEDSSAE